MTADCVLDGQPESTNPGQALRDSAARKPRKPALICGDQILTYGALDRSTDALACWLSREGLQPGDRIAIHWCNSVDVITRATRNAPPVYL